MADIAESLREILKLEAVKHMAANLLKSENKKLKNITRFSAPNGLSPVPAGVYPFSASHYALLTPDGLVEIKEDDYILQTTDNQFYFIRLEKVE